MKLWEIFLASSRSKNSKVCKFFQKFRFPKIGFVWRINEIPEKFQAENIQVVKWIPQRTLFSKFLNQLAVDAGVGLRMDITLFVIRLDVAFPLRKPWVIPPSVIRDINFIDPAWRRQNLVYNLAIGYPF